VISIDFYKTSFNKIDSNIINESTSTQDIETIQDNAKDGDIKAMVALANLYYEGKHIEQSYKKSFKWYQKSAKQGNFDAQYYLSDMYYNGIGTKQNYKQAFDWCKKSAEQGNSDAQYTLACMYYNGEGIDKDFQKAFELCEKSAEQNNSHAQSWLANIYFRKFFDSGLKSDYDKTIEYLKTLKAYPLEELKIFENLTEKEITIALADMYYNGQGSNQVKNYKKAFEIYKTADIIVDQILIGTYGVFAIESMAMGKPVITYISDEMKEKLPSELPIVSGSVQSVESVLEELIKDGVLRREKGIAGRKYVEDYHDYRYCACILRDIYYGKSKPLVGRDAFDQVKEMRRNMENGVNAKG
jgi:hypothetical protein